MKARRGLKPFLKSSRWLYNTVQDNRTTVQTFQYHVTGRTNRGQTARKTTIRHLNGDPLAQQQSSALSSPKNPHHGLSSPTLDAPVAKAGRSMAVVANDPKAKRLGGTRFAGLEPYFTPRSIYSILASHKNMAIAPIKQAIVVTGLVRLSRPRR